jgi:DNA-binding transcriptional LysR family regulator
MLNLNDVYLFARVVEHGGFAAAARALNMPKSTLSTRISRLETRVNARLIQRTSRRFGVTEVGREFYRHASAMLLQAAAAEDVITRRLSGPSGTVNLSCSPGTSHAGLARVLARFVAHCPGVRVVQATTNRNVDLIEEGIDIVVRAHEKPLPDSGLVQRQIGFSPRWLVAAPGYIERTAVPEKPADLARHEGLSMSQMMTGKSEWVLQRLDRTSARVRIGCRLCMDDPESVKMAALEERGIAAVPAGICRAEIESGALVRVLPEWFAGGATITVLTPHRRGTLPSVRALSTFISGHLPEAMSLLPPA